jgi:hypothetical protein
MASIEPTAYPRFRGAVPVREPQDVYSPNLPRPAAWEEEDSTWKTC